MKEERTRAKAHIQPEPQDDANAVPEERKEGRTGDALRDMRWRGRELLRELAGGSWRCVRSARHRLWVCTGESSSERQKPELRRGTIPQEECSAQGLSTLHAHPNLPGNFYKQDGSLGFLCPFHDHKELLAL